MKLSFFKKQRPNPKKSIRKVVISINPLIIKDYKSQITNHKSKSGFTLVELMVSVAITGILMIGISTFFSSTFNAMFRAQNRAGSTAQQFAVNEIIRDKFTTIQSLIEVSPAKDWMISINRSTKNQLPFSYIGKDAENHLAFKDMMIFNKIDENHYYGNSGEGYIRQAVNGGIIKNLDIKNFAGFAKVEDDYYVALPNENKVKKCSCSNQTCQPSECTNLTFTTELRSPTDIAYNSDDEVIYISNSESGGIIEYDIVGENEITGNPKIPKIGLKYPTGLAYYDDGTVKWLFVAETFANKIRRINLTSGSAVTTIVGEGDNEDCDNITAKFCKLNMPTGLFANDSSHELFIADSGNNRVLKVSDPGPPSSLTFNFSPGDNYKLDRIVFENANWTGGGTYNKTASNLIGDVGHYNPVNKTFLSPLRLTTYSVDSGTYGGGNCKSDSSGFYVNNEDTLMMGMGKKLKIGNNAYTVQNVLSEDCKINEDDATLVKYKIVIVTDISAESVGHNDTVYPSNQDEIIIQLDGISGNPAFKGFQTFTIKTYDVAQGLVSTNYQTKRIGDEILGTDEDIITVEKNNLIFPTGVSDLYVADSGYNKVIRISDNHEEVLNPINVTTFTTFDYISNFELADKDPKTGDPDDPDTWDLIDPLKFEKLNSDKILELTIHTKVDDETIQTYKLNAAIPTP